MFPAYDRDSPPRRIAPPEEDSTFSNLFTSYISFKKKDAKEQRRELRRQERKERRDRERKQREKQILREQLASHHSVKVC